jgi:hypothetical protein
VQSDVARNRGRFPIIRPAEAILRRTIAIRSRFHEPVDEVGVNALRSRSPPTMPDSNPATRADIERLERRLDALIDEFRKERDIHLKRIAQIQADIDIIRGAWARIKTDSR